MGGPTEIGGEIGRFRHGAEGRDEPLLLRFEHGVEDSIEASPGLVDEGGDVAFAEDRFQQFLVEHRGGSADSQLGSGETAGMDEDRQDGAGAQDVEPDAGHLRPSFALGAHGPDLIADHLHPFFQPRVERRCQSRRSTP